MSKEIESKLKDHDVLEYWGGGTRGVMIQVSYKNTKIKDTIQEQLNEPGFIQLDMEEAAGLMSVLGDFIYREASRRQGLLKKKLEEIASQERTILHEISELSSALTQFPVVSTALEFISKVCPKW